MPADADKGGPPADPGDLLKALESAAGQATWTPLFVDEFGRASLGEDWRIVGGQARLENGWLRLSGRAGDVYAVVRRPFPDSVRIEFDARFPAGTNYVSDLACFLAGDERKCDAAGYCLSLGADGNTCTRIQRQGMDVRIKPGLAAESGRTYHLAGELLGGELRFFVDGQMVLRYVDLVPLTGLGHDHLGLASFREGAEFANVRVLTRSAPESVGIFTVADAYSRDGLCDRAIEKYRQISAAHVGQPLELLAQCKVGLALFAAERWAEAEAQLRGLGRKAAGTDMEHLVDLWRGQALAMMGKLDEALHIFSRVQGESGDPGIMDEVAVACGMLSKRLTDQARWLESGRCAKFLFEKLKTPLIETRHMFHSYGRRLAEAALFEEEFQVLRKLLARTDASRDAADYFSTAYGCAAAARMAGKIDEARKLLDQLEAWARKAGDAGMELRVFFGRAEMSLALGHYAKALELVAPLAGTKEEELQLGACHWGITPADLHAAALVLLGRADEALEDLDAGRISTDALDLRLILAAELFKRGHAAAARECLAILEDNLSSNWSSEFMAKALPALRGEAPAESLREYVDSTLRPSLQPLGVFLVGLALWTGGEDQAAVLTWSEAKGASPDTMPAWHWANLFLSRVGQKQ